MGDGSTHTWQCAKVDLRPEKHKQVVRVASALKFALLDANSCKLP